MTTEKLIGIDIFTKLVEDGRLKDAKLIFYKDNIMKLAKRVSQDKCVDCGRSLGEFHLSGCDQEECPRCGDQLISCSCCAEYDCLIKPTSLNQRFKKC